MGRKKPAPSPEETHRVTKKTQRKNLREKQGTKMFSAAVPVDTLHSFRVLSHAMNKKIGEAVTEALHLWLQKHNAEGAKLLKRLADGARKGKFEAL